MYPVDTFSKTKQKKRDVLFAPKGFVKVPVDPTVDLHPVRLRYRQRCTPRPIGASEAIAQILWSASGVEATVILSRTGGGGGGFTNTISTIIKFKWRKRVNC